MRKMCYNVISSEGEFEMKNDFIGDIYYNDEAFDARDISVVSDEPQGRVVNPDYARERIAFLNGEIEKIDRCINRVELNIAGHRDESVKRGVVGTLDEMIRDTREKKRELGSISDDDYKNAKSVVRGGVFGASVVGVIGFMMSGLGAVPLYMVIGLAGGGVLSLLANDSNAIFTGLKRIYLNYKQFIYRAVRGICEKKREKRFYTLRSYYNLEDELEELRYEKEDLLDERDGLQKGLDLFYRGKSNECRNSYHFDVNERASGYGMDDSRRSMREIDGYDGKIRRR